MRWRYAQRGPEVKSRLLDELCEVCGFRSAHPKHWRAWAPCHLYRLKDIEKSKIAGAKKFFAKITNDQVKYEMIDSYGKPMDLVK